MKKLLEENETLTLWFLCSALPLTVIYLFTKFHFNLFSTFQDMARTCIHYEKWLRLDKSINIQGRIMVLGFVPFPVLPHLSINQVSFKSQQQFYSYLPDKVPDGQTKRRLYARHCNTVKGDGAKKDDKSWLYCHFQPNEALIRN